MRSPSVIAIAYAAFLGMLLITGGLVLTGDLRVEDSGPVIVFGVAFLSVFYLLFAPTKRAR